MISTVSCTLFVEKYMKLLKLLSILEKVLFSSMHFFFFLGLLCQGPKTVVWSRLWWSIKLPDLTSKNTACWININFRNNKLFLVLRKQFFLWFIWDLTITGRPVYDLAGLTKWLHWLTTPVPLSKSRRKGSVPYVTPRGLEPYTCDCKCFLVLLQETQMWHCCLSISGEKTLYLKGTTGKQNKQTRNNRGLWGEVYLKWMEPLP